MVQRGHLREVRVVNDGKERHGTNNLSLADISNYSMLTLILPRSKKGSPIPA